MSQCHCSVVEKKINYRPGGKVVVRGTRYDGHCSGQKTKYKSGGKVVIKRRFVIMGHVQLLRKDSISQGEGYVT